MSIWCRRNPISWVELCRNCLLYSGALWLVGLVSPSEPIQFSLFVFFCRKITLCLLQGVRIADYLSRFVFSFPYKLMISVQNGLADWYLMKLYGNRYQLYQWSTAWVDQEWKQLSLDWIILGISIQSALYYLLLENRLNSWFLKFWILPILDTLLSRVPWNLKPESFLYILVIGDSGNGQCKILSLRKYPPGTWSLREI